MLHEKFKKMIGYRRKNQGKNLAGLSKHENMSSAASLSKARSKRPSSAIEEARRLNRSQYSAQSLTQKASI